MLSLLSTRAARQMVSVLLLVLLLGTSLLWVWHMLGMQGDGGMSSCLLAGGRIMLCTLSAVDQIGLLEEMFGTVLPFTGALLILVTTLLAIGSVVLGTLRTGSNPSAVSRRFLQRFPGWRPLEHLREAFSQGILHPKIYESASY